MRVLANIILLAILVLSAKTVSENISNTPAFNASLRAPNVFGDEQSVLSRSMYNYPDYLLQIGTSFLRADLLPSSDTEAMGEYASTELAMARAVLAVEVLETSVSLDPGNALAWETMAWGYLMAGDADASRQALKTSWQLAPYHEELASLRLTLADAIFAEVGDNVGLTKTDEEKAAMERDLETLEAHRPADFAFHTAEDRVVNQ